MKKILNALICLIGILGITLGIIEIISRYYFKEEVNLSIKGRERLEEFKQTYIHRTRAEIPISSEDEYIIFIGDSFTYGDQVKAEESYPKVYERCIQRKGRKEKVLNLGIRANNLLDHALVIEDILQQKLAHIKIKQIIIGLTQNDRYSAVWSLHPYEVCPQYYKFGFTRDLHYHLFSAFYFDHLVNKKSNSTWKDEGTEKCLKEHFDKMLKIIESKDVKFTTTYLRDAIKKPDDNGVLNGHYEAFFNGFKRDFPTKYLVINEIFENFDSSREIYSADNYHFNASTNAIIGEYLCEKIKL